MMKRSGFNVICFYLQLVVVCLGIVACSDDDPASPSKDQTVFMYLPWSTNLTSYFYTNVADLKSVIKKGILKNERVVVYFATSATEADLYELIYKDGDCIEKMLKHYSYTNPDYTTAEGITSILNDVQSFSPAERYAMIIGCHGFGWIPVNGMSSRVAGQKMHWEYEGVPLTRYFGGTTSQYQTDITTLAKGITNAGIKWNIFSLMIVTCQQLKLLMT